MEPCKVDELRRFPLKSMGGERLDHLEFDAERVVGDPRLAVRDIETGPIASAKRPGRWGVLLSCRATTDGDESDRASNHCEPASNPSGIRQYRSAVCPKCPDDNPF